MNCSITILVAGTLATCAHAADRRHADEHGAQPWNLHADAPAAEARGAARQDDGGIAGRVPSWAGIGPFGGDVQDVGFSPVDPNIVLAAIAPSSGSGALYRSTDAGATWNPVTGLTNTDVYDIEFAPDGTIYVGTIDSVRKSTNNGASFTLLNLGIGLNDQVFDVAIDPNNSQVIWAGIADAIGNQPVNLMQSVNGGATWQNRTPPLASPISGKAIAINPANTQEIFAGFAGSFGGGQVWVSTNGGLNWVNRSAGLPNTPVNDIVHDGTRALVTGGQLFGGQNFGLFQSSNLGVTWTPMHDGTWPTLVLNDIAFDPNNASIINLASATAGLFRSTTGGASWTFGVGGTSNASLNAVRYAPGSSTRMALGANSVGVYLSNNGGSSFTLSNSGISRVNIRGIASNPVFPNELAAAFEGLNNGGVYTSLDGGATWTLENVPATRYSNVAFSPHGTLYAISSGPSSIAPEGVYRRNPATGIWVATGPDQGSLFESDLGTIRFGDDNDDLIFAGGSDFGVAGFEATVWRKPAGSTTWTKTYEGIEPNEVVTDIDIAGGSGNQTVIASYVDFSGSSGGGALRSTTSGANFVISSAGLPPTVQANALARDATNAQTFYLADRNFSGGGLYRTIDAGQSWTSTGFSSAVVDIVADPTDPLVLYILQGSSPFVQRSVNAGATFSPFNTGLSFTGGVNRLALAPAPELRLLLATTAGAYATDIEPGNDCPANIVTTGSSANQVDVDDLLAVITSWGPCPGGPPPASCPANIATAGSSANAVDVDDLLLVITSWGACP